MGELAGDESYLFQYFATSLSGTAFEWYAKLKPGSILDWRDMQRLGEVPRGGEEDIISRALRHQTKERRVRSLKGGETLA